MADQHLVVAPSALCREHDHHTFPVAVADSVAVWNEEACATRMTNEIGSVELTPACRRHTLFRS